MLSSGLTLHLELSSCLITHGSGLLEQWCEVGVDIDSEGRTTIVIDEQFRVIAVLFTVGLVEMTTVVDGTNRAGLMLLTKVKEDENRRHIGVLSVLNGKMERYRVIPHI
jgi:hypothetical protein